MEKINMLLIPHIQKAKCSVSGPAHKQPGKRDSGPVLIQLSPKSLPIPQSGTSKLSNWTVVFVLVYIHRTNRWNHFASTWIRFLSFSY